MIRYGWARGDSSREISLRKKGADNSHGMQISEQYMQGVMHAHYALVGTRTTSYNVGKGLYYHAGRPGNNSKNIM